MSASKAASGRAEPLSRDAVIASSVRWTPRRLTLVAVLALALLALVPSAQAQDTAAVATQIQLGISGFSEPDGGDSSTLQVPIAPGKSRTFTLFVNYTWEQGGYSMDATNIHLRTRAGAGWLRPSLDQTLVRAHPPDAPGMAGTDTIEVNLTLSVSEEAPAFDGEFVFVEGRAEQNADPGRGNLQRAPENGWNRYAGLVNAGVLAQVRVTPEERLIQIRGGETRTIGVDVENTGNVNLTSSLKAIETGDNIDVDIGGGDVEIPVEGTTQTDMTITVDDILAGGESGFVLEARPEATDEAQSGTSTISRTDLSLSMTPLPMAVLFGDQTIFEVFLFTAIFVSASFAAAWPMTHWYETRRKELGKAPFGAGGSSRSRGRSSDDDDDGSTGKDRSTGTVHGVPKQGEDYEVVEETDIWEQDEETPGDAETSEPSEETDAGDDAEVEIVDDDDIFG